MYPKPTRKEKARKPLSRKKRMRKGSSRRVQQKTEEARNYHAWLAQRPCVCEADSYSCDGPVQVSHIRNLGEITGTGRKPSDWKTLPQCRKHHEDLEQFKGYFRQWTKEHRDIWAWALIYHAWTMYERETGRLVEREAA